MVSIIIIKSVLLSSLLVNYIANLIASHYDKNSIEEPPIPAYLLLIMSSVILAPVYFKLFPVAFLLNLLALGLIAVVVSIVVIILGIHFIGSYDLVYIYIQHVSLFPMFVFGHIIPSATVHVFITWAVAYKKLYRDGEMFVRMFEIHELTSRYIYPIIGLTYVLI